MILKEKPGKLSGDTGHEKIVPQSNTVGFESQQNIDAIISDLKDRLPDILTSTTLRKEATGSFCGPCIKCGGTDRFVFKTDSEKCWCRKCHERPMDIIDFHCWLSGKEIKDLFKQYLPEHNQGLNQTQTRIQTLEKKDPDTQAQNQEKNPDIQKLWDGILKKNTNEKPVFDLLCLRRKLLKETVKRLFDKGKVRFKKHARKVSVAIPFTTLSGYVMAIQCLSVDGSAYPYTVKDGNLGKNKVFVKGSIAGGDCFFQCGKPIESAKIIIIAESVINAMTAHECFPDACCLALGSSKNTKKVKILIPYLDHVEKVVVCIDNDEPSEKMLKAITEILNEVHAFTWRSDDPDRFDINDLLQKGEKNRIIDLFKGAGLVRYLVKPPQKPENKVILINGLDLFQKEFQPIRWAVKDILAEGCSILAGKPKCGKSILCLNLAIAIVAGSKALSSINVEPGPVLYLALEDVHRRLKTRLQQMLQDDNPTALKNLHLATDWPKMGDGGLRKLDETIKSIHGIRLVIIDTLKMFRPIIKGNKSLYDSDYEPIAAIKGIADKNNVSILLIHHLRKSDADDIMDTMSGSLGLTGATDTNLILERQTGNADATLHVNGRDVESAEYALRFQPGNVSWRILGAAQEVKSTDKKQRVYDALKQAGKALSPKDIAAITGYKNTYVRNTMPSLIKEGYIQKRGRGKYIYWVSCLLNQTQHVVCGYG